MEIIIIYNHKGGVAKTTTTINACTFLSAYYNKKVAIVDADDLQWSTHKKYQRERNNLHEKYSVEELKKLLKEKKIVDYDVYRCFSNPENKLYYNDKTIPSFSELLNDLGNDYDYLFVDLGNRTLQECDLIFNMANQIIIPYSNDELEISEAVTFYDIIKEEYQHVKVNCLIVKITVKQLINHMKIKELLKKRHNLTYYDSIVLSRERLISKRSFFYPLNYQIEQRDTGNGFVAFIEELISK